MSAFPRIRRRLGRLRIPVFQSTPPAATAAEYEACLEIFERLVAAGDREAILDLMYRPSAWGEQLASWRVEANVSAAVYRFRARGVMRAARREQSLYFILNQSAGLVKIGIAEHPLERVRSLSVGAATALQLIGHLRGGAQYEKPLHILLAADRVHGEWFRATDQICRMAADPQTVLVALQVGGRVNGVPNVISSTENARREETH